MWTRTVLVVVSIMLGSLSAGETYAQMPDEVKIAILLPLSGELSSFGTQLDFAAELAVADFNAYLEENGIAWRLVAVSEDTETNPVRALEKVQVLHAHGIDMIVGPVGSAQLSNILPYMNSNDMMAISPSSTASALAIPDDAAFRMVPNDVNQARAFGATLEYWGIEAIVPMWRGEVYGDGLTGATVSDFESRGGVVYDGIRYNPESSEFSVSVAELADSVSEAVDRHGADRTAVLLVAFDESVPIFQTASTYDILNKVRWMGAEGIAKSVLVASDPIAAQFAIDTRLHTVQLLLNLGGRADSVREYVYERFGSEPLSQVHTMYDAVWLVGLSILEANSTNSADVRKVVRDVAASYSGGALSSAELNEAGDLALASYEMWRLDENNWVRSVVYDSQSDSIGQAGVDGTIFVPDYIIQGGAVQSMYTNPQEAALIIEIMADGDGMLDITLPRDLVDSRADGADSGFFVLINGEEAVHEEAGADEDSRTLSVGFAAGANRIEIIGTSVAVPEFEEIGLLVLAAGLVLVAAISAMYRAGAARPLLRVR